MASMATKSQNEKLIQIFGKLSEIMTAKGDRHRARAYSQAKNSLQTVNFDIKTVMDLKKLRDLDGIGTTILQKCEEILNTGTLRLLEKEKNNPLLVLTKVYGIATKKARVLINQHNIRTIDELKQRPDLLTAAQKCGVKHYDDFLKKIPRSEIKEYEKKLYEVWNTLETSSEALFMILGSYRRGKNESGDIDIAITSNSNDSAIYTEFMDALYDEGLVTDFLSKGPKKSLTVGRLNNKTPFRRVDFMYFPYEEYPYATLYFTGNGLFNVAMRTRIQEFGYTLNEHGIYSYVNKKKGKKIKLETAFSKECPEKIVFDFFGFEYREPKDRLGYQAVALTKEGEAKLNLKKLEREGINALTDFDIERLTTMHSEACRMYYNQQPIISDEVFDLLVAHIEKNYPGSQVIQNIGADVEVEKEKVELPYIMPSMNKIKPDTNALTIWRKKYKKSVMITGKLDGMSALYVVKKNASTGYVEANLYSRGNGKIGQKISHLLRHIKLPKTNSMVVRGELIIRRDKFKKYRDLGFSHSRNFVCGIVNRKTINEETRAYLKDISFVSYELIEPRMIPSEQFNYLRDHKFKVVVNSKQDDITNECLSEALVRLRKSYIYDIDGLVISENKMYSRTDKNPKHAFAFKMVVDENTVESIVTDVLWSVAPSGYIKPRVQYEPVIVDGVKLEFATAHNAAFIRDNSIGVGAVIQVIRSGDVIPKIVGVTKPATAPKMYDGVYEWNESNVDIMIPDEEKSSNQDLKMRRIIYFFEKIGVDGLGPGNIKRIVNAGYDTIPQILSLTPIELQELEGFKTKLSNKLCTNIKAAVDKTSLYEFMVATKTFGRGIGETKLKAIMVEYPNILTEDLNEEEVISRISNMRGFAKKTAKIFATGLITFKEFIEEAEMDEIIQEKLETLAKKTALKKKHSHHILNNTKIVFTGFRDGQLTSDLETLGAKVTNSLTKKTDYVVYDMDKTTTKIKKAEKLGIKCISKKELLELM